ncbi:inversin-A-like isoform X3 [Pomacea canaliculata]|uniref:inversin-A-like isoform X3 n=1 Tax=Pomacea canaliculata TaxID=400727 RepID=UPI000D729759|nr:inversin-A-like isoform X3 [Pomacea canaliculata]
MVVKRRDFQKAAAFIHEFLLKMNEDMECAELRDTLNLALLHMQKYYRALQSRSQEKSTQHTLSLSARGLSPMTPFVDAPDKFRWRWLNLDSSRFPSNMSVSESVNMSVLPPIIEAAKKGDLTIMQDLIDHDPSIVNDCDSIGRTGLMYAVHFFQHNAVNFLLENNAEVNATAHDGSTALHRACHDSNDVAVSLLLDLGADIHIQDMQGRAAIHWAVTTETTDCLQLLLDNSADPATKDKDGLTPCMWACRMDHIKHFELLSCSNYEISEPDGIERDSNGRTWLHWAVRRTEPLECLLTLLTKEGSSYQDEEGKTVLMLAAEMGSLPATKLIIDIAGPMCVGDCDNQNRTALHLATIGGHGDVVNYLLEHGADINQPDRYNATAWDYARSRQLHYCQLIIMSHQRQRLISNPTSPLANGLALLINSENGVQEDFNRMSFQSRSDFSTPVTPPYPPNPPKRSRTKRMLARRANSLTGSQEINQNSMISSRTSSSASERKKERIEVSIDTRMAVNQTTYVASRQDSLLTNDTDIGNVIRDVEINGDDEIDNVSVGGMDVSDIDDSEHNNMTSNNHNHGFYAALPPSQHQLVLSRQQQVPSEEHQLQPQPPRGGTQLPHPPVNMLEDHGSRDIQERLEPHVHSLQSTTSNKLWYSPQAPSRPSNRSQQFNRGRLPVPSPPTNDPQRPHMIRQHQPLPPKTSQKDFVVSQQQVAGFEDSRQGDLAVSPPVSSQSSDQISGLTQLSAGFASTPASSGTGLTAGPSTGAPTVQDQTRANPNGKSPPGVIEGRRITPALLSPLTNAPKLPADASERTPKKKKKKKLGAASGSLLDKDQDVKSPPQHPLDIPPPRGFAAPLHPQQLRGHSASHYVPKYSKSQPQIHEPRHSEGNAEDNSRPPVINGFTVPIRENLTGSARPANHQPVESEEPAFRENGNVEWANKVEVVKESIAEEDEGELIPPPQAFCNSAHQGQDSKYTLSQPMSQAWLPDCDGQDANGSN